MESLTVAADSELDMSNMLTDECLENLEMTHDDSEPVDLISVVERELPFKSGSESKDNEWEGYVDPDEPIVKSHGRFLTDLDGGDPGDEFEAGRNDRNRDGSESSFGSRSDSDCYRSCSEDDGGSDEDSPDEYGL